MVCVALTLVSMNEGGKDHRSTYIYTVDGTREETQGTLRDNRRGDEIADIIQSKSPSMIRGVPPADSHPIFSIYIKVLGTRGDKASHSVEWERHDCSAKYNTAANRMMENVRGLEWVLRTATRTRKNEEKK